MFLRISSAALVCLVLAACSATAPKVAEGAEHIACALAGASQFAPNCAVERVTQGGALFLIVRHPDGAFRRFEVLEDGRGLALADGAEVAQIELSGAELEVAVGPDRYRFPATVKRDARQ
jgi:hypothetical protein